MNAELTKAQNNLKQFQAALAKSTNVKEIEYLQRSIKGLENQIGSISGQLSGKFTSSSNQATNTLTNLNRVVQDAPYGFIGIANNLNPLVESFGRLKAESGSTGGAIKSLVSSLSGPGGIGFAFAAVTTAITFAQVGFSAWTRGSKETQAVNQALSESAQKLSIDIKYLGSDLEGLKNQFETIKEYKKLEFDIQFGKGFTSNLKFANLGVTQLGYEQAAANVEYDKARKAFDDASSALFSFTQSQRGAFESTNSFADAVSKLGDLSTIGTADLSQFNDEQKQYIQNVITAGKKVIETRDAYGSYNDKISLAKLNIKALTEEERRQQAERAKNADTASKAIAEFERSIKAIQKTGISLGTPQFDINEEKIKAFEGILRKLIEKYNVDPKSTIFIKLQARMQDIQFENLAQSMRNSLRKDILTATNDPIPVDGINLDIPKTPFDQNQLDAAYREGLIKQFEAAAKKFNVAIPVGTFNLNTEGIKKQFKDTFDPLKAEAQKQQDILNGILTQAAQDIAINFGETLGAALAGTASIGDFFTGLLAQVGKGMQAFGKAMIQFAIKVQVIKDWAIANPALAIAGGIALIALGALLAAKTKKQAFAVGTNYAPGGMALVGERGPELVNLPRGSQVVPAAQTSNIMKGAAQQVEVFGVLRGQDIYFSNKKYSQTYRRTT